MSRVVTWISSVTCMVVLLCSTVPAFAVGNSESAGRAARYVAIQSSQTTDVAAAVDALFALVAVGDPVTVQPAGRLLGIVKDMGAGYARSSPDNAVRIVLLAAALGTDSRTLIGIDALPVVMDGIHPDGSFGATPNPASAGLALVALARAKVDPPQVMVRFLVSSANYDGGFGMHVGSPSEAEPTGLALMGLLTLTDSISAKAATTRAIAWATAQQQSDGSWSGPNRIVTTSLVGTALQAAGLPQAMAVQYVVAEQGQDGGIPRSVPSTESVQIAALLLADTNYLALTGGSFATSVVAAAPAPTARPVPVGTQSFPWALPVLGGLVIVAGIGLVLTRRGATQQATSQELKP